MRNEHIEINKLSREVEAFFIQEARDSKKEISDIVELRQTIKKTKKHLRYYGGNLCYLKKFVVGFDESMQNFGSKTFTKWNFRP